MPMVYSWKPQSHIKLEAGVVAERFSALAQEHHGLSPRIVLDDATTRDSPTHDYFEWDEAEAADRYRLEQARMLLKALVVKVSAEQSEPVRAFVVVEGTEEEGRAYQPIMRVMGDQNLRRQLLDRALKELDDWRERYKGFEEVAGIVAEVARVLATWQAVPEPKPKSAARPKARETEPVFA